MTIIDWIIIAILLYFGVTGFWHGLVATVVSLVGTLCAFFVSFRFFKQLGDWLVNTFGWTSGVVHFIVFAASFILLFVGIQLLFKLINRVLKIITELPIISFANRIFGLLFGLFQGVLICAVLLLVASKFPLSDYITTAIDNSAIAPKIQGVAVLAEPMVPAAVQAVKSATTLFE